MMNSTASKHIYIYANSKHNKFERRKMIRTTLLFHSNILLIHNNNTTRKLTQLCYASKLQSKSKLHYETLRLLEWDKLCDSVSSFAATSLGHQATKDKLWRGEESYEDSLKLLEETNAAVQMHKHGACRLSFSSLRLSLVKCGIENAGRGLPVNANEAIAVKDMLELADVLQLNLKATVKEDADWYNRFLPLSQLIMELVPNRSLVSLIQKVIDEDGSVKDSASSALKQARNQVRLLEKKLYQLMDVLIRKEMKEGSFMEVSNSNGRWCIKSGVDHPSSFKGLLLSSDLGAGNIVEPLLAVPLNDDLERARASVAKAEEEVLLVLTEKMKNDIENIEYILKSIIQLDVINARATYGLSYDGACPNLYIPEQNDGPLSTESYLSREEASMDSFPVKREWILYMPKAYHPLLLQQHRQNLQKKQKDVGNGTAVSDLQQPKPVPVDFFVEEKTRVLVITGPNTGGKTICLKTIGLAAMMAKSGLYVLSSESVQLPWFDSIFADIGDEQSLSQSLSTFSGHLKQISDIRSHSTSRSLVLLDEVGAGTNPLEGAALGMSLLESFADSGALLTIATTHHGELKSLKYSNDVFENACMEFDEVNLKPTYKILWGVPGRSNAINISEKLGLDNAVVTRARELYGEASAEINEVIVDMERFKQEFQEHLHESHHYLMVSRRLHKNLIVAKRNIMEHVTNQRYAKLQEISETAATARSILHRKVRQLRASPKQPSQTAILQNRKPSPSNRQSSMTDNNGLAKTRKSEISFGVEKQLPPDTNQNSVQRRVPKVGDTVQVLSLGRKAMVLSVDLSKEEIVVQAGMMKLKVKLTDVAC